LQRLLDHVAAWRSTCAGSVRKRRCSSTRGTMERAGAKLAALQRRGQRLHDRADVAPAASSKR
jgi:hypothetical protein